MSDALTTSEKLAVEALTHWLRCYLQGFGPEPFREKQQRKTMDATKSFFETLGIDLQEVANGLARDMNYQPPINVR